MFESLKVKILTRKYDINDVILLSMYAFSFGMLFGGMIVYFNI